MRLTRRISASAALAITLATACLTAAGVAPAARADDATAAARIVTCGTGLCTGGQPWVMHAASIYKSIDNPLPAVELAQQAGANTIRLTDFLTEGQPADAAAADESAWVRLDTAIAVAGSHGMRVDLDLSAYRNLLAAQGLNPYTQDWTPFLARTATRVNTVTGMAYRDDPTIALVSMAGEPAAPNGRPGPTVPTTTQLTRFYAITLHTWSLLAPQTLATAGGLTHLDWNSGIDWGRICALPDNDVCAMHVYGHRSLRKGITPMADLAQRLGRPWIMEETGVPQRIGDAARAAWLTAVFTRSWRNGAAGVGVWNIGPESVGSAPGTYDINPSTPLAWAALQRGFAGGPGRP